MDPFWSLRLSYPSPTLFGLLDDVADYILGVGLGLSRTKKMVPEAVVALVSLRLVSRETYFFLERRQFPLLTALPQRILRGGVGISRTTPWFYREKVFAHVVLQELPLWRALDLAIWGLFSDGVRIAIAAAAIRTHKFRTLEQAIHHLPLDDVRNLKVLALKLDVPTGYVLCAVHADENESEEAKIKEFLRYDAVKCFDKYLSYASDRLKLLLKTNQLLIEHGFKVPTPVRIHEKVTSSLARLAVPTTAAEDEEEEGQRRGLKRVRPDS